MGNDNACLELSRLYSKGAKIEKNLDVAIDWAKKAPKDKESLITIFDLLLERNKEDDCNAAFSMLVSSDYKQDPDIALRIARAYERGIGVDKNIDAAIELISRIDNETPDVLMMKADLLVKRHSGGDLEDSFNIYADLASLGNSEAIGRLARAYSRGTGVIKDLDKAISYYQIAADAGVRWARNELFDILMESRVPDNSVRAIEVIKPSVDANDPYAIGRMARSYRDGRGVERDLEKAVELYKQAGDRVVWAKRELADLYIRRNSKGDSKEAFLIYSELAKNGDAESFGSLARCFRYGRGVKKDIVQSIEYYKKASDAGIPWAKTELFDILMTSELSNDHVFAVNTIEGAAEAGEPYAMGRMGRAYRDGRGVNKDLDKAVDWMSKAMDKNVPWAASELVYILLERGTRADLKRAFDIANQGSKNNDYRCMLVLGEMYASGMYVKKDPDKAIEWINLGEKLRK